MKVGVPNDYSPTEIDIIKKHYPSTPKGILLELLPRRSWGSIRMKASKLGITRRGRLEEHNRRCVSLFNAWDKHSAWLLGVLFPKSVISQGRTQQLIFCSTRKLLVEEVASALAIPGVVSRRLTPTLPQYFITTSNKELIEKLIQKGLVPLKKERKFPDIPDQSIWHFLRGFFDSQSWILAKQRRWGVGFVCRDVVDRIRHIFDKSAGIKNLHTGEPYRVAYKKDNNEWFFTVGGRNLSRLYQYLYAEPGAALEYEDRKKHFQQLLAAYQGKPSSRCAGGIALRKKRFTS